MRKFSSAIILVIFCILTLCPYPAKAGLGSPKISVSATVYPSTTLQWGDSATLTVMVKETGGEDWANDVIVSVSAPQGSKIVINPTERGPVDIDKLGSTSFSFSIRVPEYEEPGKKTITVIVEYGDTGWLNIGETRYKITKYVYLTVKKPLAELIVQTTPSQARVYINNDYKGTTPLELTLEEGSYDLRIEKNGYKTIQEVISLYPGKTTTITRTLEPIAVPVTIESNPSGAEVYIDGEYRGVTPLTVSLLPGNYYLKLVKSGYHDYTTQISVIAGESITISRTLTKISIPTTTPPTTPHYSPPSSPEQLNPIYLLLLLLLILVIPGAIYKRSRKSSSSSSTPSPPYPPPSSPSLPRPPESPAAPAAKDFKPEVKGFPQELLTKYQPLEFLGEGGFAKVFKVKRKSDGEIIALKISNLDEKAKKFLIKEMRAWKLLDHPNIVKLYNAYTDPIPHLEIEYVEGVELNGKTIHSLEEYPKPVGEELAMKLVKEITQAIKYAHSQNVLHRDIKPPNILLRHDFTPKLTDWGLAKVGAVSTTATSTKGFTLLYVAPEQIDEKTYGRTDQRTDLYQLGMVLYELLTGKLPYEGHSPAELIGKIANPNYLPQKPSEVNPGLKIFDKFFEKALAKRKEDRFQSADEVLQALEELEKVVDKKKEIKETVAELKKTLLKSQLALKQSRTADEERSKMLEMLNVYQKLAILCCEVNSQSELLETLESLKYHVKDEKLIEDINGAIKYLRYYMQEKLPISEEFAQRLNELFSRIKQKVKEESS